MYIYFIVGVARENVVDKERFADCLQKMPFVLHFILQGFGLIVIMQDAVGMKPV